MKISRVVFIIAVSLIAMSAVALNLVIERGRSSSRLVPIESIEELRAEFNSDVGSVRIILLMSPT